VRVWVRVGDSVCESVWVFNSMRETVCESVWESVCESMCESI